MTPEMEEKLIDSVGYIRGKMEDVVTKLDEIPRGCSLHDRRITSLENHQSKALVGLTVLSVAATVIWHKITKSLGW